MGLSYITDASFNLFFNITNTYLLRFSNHATSSLFSVCVCGLIRTTTYFLTDKLKHPGENLYGGWGSSGSRVGAAIDSWYNEVKYYNYSTGGFSMSKSRDSGAPILDLTTVQHKQAVLTNHWVFKVQLVHR